MHGSGTMGILDFVISKREPIVMLPSISGAQLIVIGGAFVPKADGFLTGLHTCVLVSQPFPEYVCYAGCVARQVGPLSTLDHLRLNSRLAGAKKSSDEKLYCKMSIRKGSPVKLAESRPSHKLACKHRSHMPTSSLLRTSRKHLCSKCESRPDSCMAACRLDPGGSRKGAHGSRQ